ncbi:hypothetical protein B5S32_g488 [[Candida] boidinii]|nr:hypothetical protein B5S32_g488 [[Candida] boidinii]
MGTLLSFILKYLLWKKHKVRIKVQSVKISFLGGRIFFKNLTIISKDGLVLVHQGWLTWRYWLTFVRKSEFELHEEDKTTGIKLDRSKNDILPTRFFLEVYGLEVFLHNRSVAYDYISKTMQDMDEKKRKGNNSDSDNTQGKENSSQINNTTTLKQRFNKKLNNSENSDSDNNDLNDNDNDNNNNNKESTRDDSKIGLFSSLQMLPISFKIRKGSLVMGNETTPTLIVYSYSVMDGDINVHPSKCSLDNYRMSSSVVATALQISLRPNVSYKNLNELKNLVDKKLYKRKLLKKFKTFKDIMSLNVKPKHGANKKKTLKQKTKSFLDHSIQGNNKRYHYGVGDNGENEDDEFDDDDGEWLGLERYLTTDNNIISRQDLEYGKYSKLLESNFVNIHYYYDSPGLVPNNPTKLNSSQGVDIGNGGFAPETGIELGLSGTTIHYGPWADRQRFHLHKMIFPSLCRDAEVFEKLRPGMTRQYAGFNIFVEVLDESIVRIPFREPSKDVIYLHNPDYVNSSISRPFGWLELKMEKGSTISTHTSYIPTVENGWENKLGISLIEPEIRSSTNHEILFRAKKHSISADVGYPLKWNGETTWTFRNHSHDAAIFLLREHITLCIDLFDDFGSGDPTPYELFRPFHYKIFWNITNYAIYLNINQRNIVNNPLDFSENTYLSFQGTDLSLDVHVPFDTIFRKSNTIDYELKTSYFDLVLDSPPWHTCNNFLSKNSVGRANNFVLDGSYTYYPLIEIDSVDTVVLSCTCDDTTLECYGFVVNYIMVIKENYFGDHIHFQTFNEFMDDLNRVEEENENPTGKVMKSQNETDVFFSFCVNNGCLILPGHIYDSKSHIALHFKTLDVDIRFTNYYMDMQANFSPINTRLVENVNEEEIFDTTAAYGKLDENSRFKPEMLIDGLSIHGHRIFGLPPIEPTYYCRWDFVAGEILIDSCPLFLDGMIRAIKNLGYCYIDNENSLGIPETVVDDVLNLSFTTPKCSIKLNNLDHIFSITLDELSVKLSDWCNFRYNARANLNIPSIVIESHNAQNPEEKLFYMETALKLTHFLQKKNFAEKRDLQQKHIKTHDAPFHRCPFLLFESSRSGDYSHQFGSIKPSIPIPDISLPLNNQTADTVLECFPNEIKEEFQDDDSSQTSSANSSSNLKFSDITNLSDTGPHFNQEKLRERKIKYHTFFGENFDPITSYNDSDFMPKYKPIPGVEYDSIVLNFSKISVLVSPEMAVAVAVLMQKFENLTLQNVIDNLQMEIMEHITGFGVTVSEVFNLKMLTPAIDIQVGNFKDYSIDKVLNNPIGLYDHVNIKIANISLALSNKSTKIPLNDIGKRYRESSEFNAALQTDKVYASVQKKREKDVLVSERPFSVSLEGIEVCFSDNNITGLVCTIDQDDTTVTLDPDNMKWLGEFVNDMSQDIKRAIEIINSFEGRGHLSQKELVYAISTAGVNYDIKHDPACITKPSFVTSIADKHVRLEDSWRIITRLRHILYNLPPDWIKKEDAMFKAEKWETPENSKGEVHNIFANWRSWEFSNIANSYVLRYVFPGSNDVKPKGSTEKEIRIQFKDISILFPVNDFFRIKNVSFLFNEHIRPVSSLEALPTIVKNQTSINHVDAFLKIGLIESKLGLYLVKIKEFVEALDPKDKMPEPGVLYPTADLESHVTKLVSQASKKMGLMESYFSVHFNIEKHKNIFKFNKSAVIAEGTYADLSICGVKPYNLDDVFPITLISNCAEFQFDVKLMNDSLLRLQIENVNSTISNSDELKTSLKLVTVDISKIKVLADSGSRRYVSSIYTFMKEDFPLIDKYILQPMSQLEKDSDTVNNADSKSLASKISEINATNILNKITFKVKSEVKINQISFEFEILSPLVHLLAYNDFSFSTEVRTGLVSSNVKFGKLVTHTLSPMMNQKLDYFHGSIEKCSISIGIHALASIFCIDVKGDLDSFRLTIPHIFKSIRQGSADLRQVNSNISQFMKAFEYASKMLNDNEPKTSRVTLNTATEASLKKASTFPNIFFNISASCNYFKTTIMHDNVQFILDISYASLSAVLDPKSKLGRPRCSVKLPSTRLIFRYGDSNNDRFTILDVNFLLDVTDPPANEKLQTFTILSEYCRLALNPFILEHLVSLFFQLDHTMESLTTYTDNSRNMKDLKISDPVSGNVDTFESLLDFFSITIISHNFCIGWLFRGSRDSFGRQDVPGIIVGYSEGTIIAAKGAGQVIVSNSYISLAYGYNDSDYYSTQDESRSKTRAFVSQYKLTYVINPVDTGLAVKARINGEKVDAKVQTPSFSAFDPLWKSIARVQDRIDRCQVAYAKFKSPVVKKEFTDSEDRVVFFSKIKSINCVFTFDGGVFEVQNPHLKINGTIPTLCLYAPTIQLAFEYLKHSTISSRHIIKAEVFTSSSDNKLDATCVPVIADVLKAVRSFIKSTQNGTGRKKSSISTVTAPTSENTPLNLERVFENFQIVFALRIEPQKLSLSCEPTARVIAVVGLDGITFRFTTESKSLSGSLEIERLRAELQHVYSRQTSGSINIENILFSAAMESKNGKRDVSTVGLISNIDAYINVQQRQDIDLFGDIWLPGEIYDESFSKQSVELRRQEVNKTFASRLREVASTTAFPWILSLILKQINLKIDFGQSLGILYVTLDKCWAVSTKSLNWDQSFKFEIGRLRVDSEGRLGGLFLMEKARMTSAISWKMDSKVLDIPLVLVSIGIGELETKLSLDYHPFFLCYIKGASISIYNQKGDGGKLDKLIASAAIDSFKVYLTALSASNFVDIYTTTLRIRQDIKASYRDVLNDSANANMTSNLIKQKDSDSLPNVREVFLDAIGKLHTILKVRISDLKLQVFPSSLLDHQALVIKTGVVGAKFTQRAGEIVENKLRLNINDFIVSLSGFKVKPTEEALSEPRVEAYMQMANTAFGGDIFVFPSWDISMDMWQESGSKVINHIFKCHFGGKVDIRWKINSIYFIREMWYAHANALSTRLTALKILTNETEEVLDESIENHSIFESVNLENRLKDVEEGQEYEYRALEVPIIETPQLKDLGNATPPLEWFGVHRAKFPNLTHQVLIVGLQKLVKEAEIGYAKSLR